MKEPNMITNRTSSTSNRGPALPPSELKPEGIAAIAAELRRLLADVFTLYLKTKNFHWHVSGPHFRDYHLLLDEQAEQIFGMTDDLAERARKLGATTLRSVGDVVEFRRLADNDAEFVSPREMLAELAGDNGKLADYFRRAHQVCDEQGDVATASLIEVWIDQTERRIWFLTEAAAE
jgi:starvation-inducible DNA-binding protein